MSLASTNSDDLSFTGERYMPSLQGGVALEHWHRYLLARTFAAGKTVLDIACGEGYGSALLAQSSSVVIGVDVSAEAIAHATRQYTGRTLDFRVGSCAAIPVEDASIDLVVSFETIEHHDQHAEMFREIKRVLKPDGLLIMSSPERPEFNKFISDFAGEINNPFHVKELDRNEFETLVEANFANVAVFGQRVVFGSAIIQEDAAPGFVGYALPETLSAAPQQTRGIARPIYLIAIASDGRLPVLTNSICEKRIGLAEMEQIWPSGVFSEGIPSALRPQKDNGPTVTASSA
jgi:SAM-dependent methyltransferase